MSREGESPLGAGIAGANVTLVPLEPRHADRSRAWADDPELMRLLGRAAPVSDAEHAAWVARLPGSADHFYLAIERNDDGVHVDNVWLWAIERRHATAEIRIVIGESNARERGLGAEALDLAARLAFAELGLHRLYAFVFGFNERARRAFERAGFTVEGRLRESRRSGDRWIDALLLGRLADDRRGEE